MSDSAAARADVVIIGAGVAGLWLAHRLERLNRSVVLLEAHAVGGGQTAFSQGIIHGGTKYALTNALTGASEIIRPMPARWRAALSGRGEIDLAGAAILSPRQHLFSTAALTSRMSHFFAGRVMHNRVRTLPRAQHPSLLAHDAFRGSVSEIDEIVLDIPSLTTTLVARLRAPVVHVRGESVRVEARREGGGPARVIASGAGESAGREARLEAAAVVCAAGAGNAALLAQAGLEASAAQKRPLHMILVRGLLEHAIWAHCLGAGPRPRLTITSHDWADPPRRIWYIGGEIAETGVGRTRLEQIAAARAELADVLPWVRLDGLEWDAVRIDRAEGAQKSGHRPDGPTVLRQGRIVFAWPTKLALAPLLADMVLAHLDEMDADGSATDLAALSGWPRPPFALPPWKEDRQWHTFDR